MTRVLLGLALVTVACAKRTTVEPAPPPIPHPDLICPEGTVGAGMAPPIGFEVYCTRDDPTTGQPIRHGGFIQWHDNGLKMAVGQFINDKQAGSWNYWYANGKPERQGAYAGGKEDGVWTSFHPTGQRESQGLMVLGKRSGAWIFWNVEKQVRSEGSFVNGEKSGVWLDYGADNQPIREREYRGGSLITLREL